MARFRAGAVRLAMMAAFAVLGAAPARAQAPAASEPPPRLEASAQLTFLDTRGNAPTQSLGAGGEITWRPGVWTHNAKALFAQTESEGVVDARSMTGLFRSARQLTPRVSGYVQYDYLRDTFAGVDQRHVGEAALGEQGLVGHRDVPHVPHEGGALGAVVARMRGQQQREAVGQGLVER